MNKAESYSQGGWQQRKLKDLPEKLNQVNKLGPRKHHYNTKYMVLVNYNI